MLHLHALQLCLHQLQFLGVSTGGGRQRETQLGVLGNCFGLTFEAFGCPDELRAQGSK